MLRQYGPSTVVAIGVGCVIAALLFIPVAALRYRRTGRLRFVDVVILVLVAVYFVALWSYTLIPLPESSQYRCVGHNVHPFAFVGDILAGGSRLWANKAALQVAFNVLLFAPLGFFFRVLLRRGVVVSSLVGFAVSLTIETTQLTGDWGLYRCAYRYFDVDDLMANTVGAVVGSLVAIPVASLLARRRPAPLVTRVTLGRRVIGVLTDLTAIVLIGIAPVVAWRAFGTYVLRAHPRELPELVEVLLGFGLPALVEGYWVIFRGRTLGEALVRLEPIAPSGSLWVRRALKFGFGVGGYLLLAAGVGGSLPAMIFVAISVVALPFTRGHRGVSHLMAGMELGVETGTATDPLLAEGSGTPPVPSPGG